MLEGVHQSAIETLNAHGYTNIEYHTGSLPEEELIERVRDAHFIGIRSRTRLTRKVFEAAEKLVAVGCFCIGTNQVDLQAATEAGIAVSTRPTPTPAPSPSWCWPRRSSCCAAWRKRNAKAHRGVWLKSAENAYEIRGKKLGIVGYGSIGSQLSVLAEGLGMEVYFHDVVTKLPLGNAKQVGSLPALLSLCDIITLHVPELPSTKNMMAATQFEQMKPNSIFINAARGTVVDIDALCDALSSGKLLGAAIDVFPVEPRSNKDEFVSPLRAFDNVILTPHVGGSTMEAQENIGYEVAEKLVKYSDNGSSITSVNFPEVALPEHPDKHRLLHVHENIPGVLSQINSVFSENGINISGQYLQTNDKVGYVVIDVDADYSKLALEKLQQVNGTIRCRRLF